MKITFLGAAGTVTGSSYVLTSESGQSILIDLGMFQGPPAIEELNYQPFAVDCTQLIGAVLTHAHLDHCGRLPLLLDKGFAGEIWMTPATRDLTELSLLDTAKIAQQDEKTALFDKELVVETMQVCRTAEYRQPFRLGDFSIIFRDAGHILGSASLEVIDTEAQGKNKKVVFSGDIGNFPEPLLHSTEFIDQADVVVMESTYGDRLHPESDPTKTLQTEINAIEEFGSDATLLIPAFSLERTQELLHMIMHLKQAGLVLAETPIFLDSPMSKKATEIYLQYPALFNQELQTDLKTGSPFGFPGLQIVRKHEESEAIHTLAGPKVIIAGSGMMTGGRIVGHAAHYLPIESTRLLIVGYQGEGTLGRQLLEGSQQVMIDGSFVQVNATISDTQAMSSHADQQQLLTWLTHIKNVKKVILTHGEDGPRTALAHKITAELGIDDVVLPRLHEEVSL